MSQSNLLNPTPLEICYEDPTALQNCNEILARELLGHTVMQAHLERLMVLILYGAMLVFGLVGNLLVIATVTLNPARSALQPVDAVGQLFYPCLLYLATADLLLIVFCIPLRVFITVYQKIKNRKLLYIIHFHIYSIKNKAHCFQLICLQLIFRR